MATTGALAAGATTAVAETTTKSMFDYLCCYCCCAEDEPEGGHNVKVEAKQGIRCCGGTCLGVCCNAESVSIVNSRSEHVREQPRAPRAAFTQFKRRSDVSRVKSDPGPSKPLGMEQRGGQHQHGKQSKPEFGCKDAKEPRQDQYYTESKRTSDGSGNRNGGVGGSTGKSA